MKLTKTVKYHYKLTEETLEKDIDKFISHARKGEFSWDYKYEGIGLKVIKQYFRILKEKFKNQEYEECKICYEKMILFCIDASCGNDKADFGYEDLLAKITKEFDNYIENYFICLVKTCNIEELAERVSRYASHLEMYGFDSDKEILLTQLTKEQFNDMESNILAKTDGMTKKDQDKQDIIYFLMHIAEIQEDKEKYLRLCERFKGVLTDKEFQYLKNEYEENKLLADKIEEKLGELKSRVNKNV
ncbi:MAG: hypothetical protein AABX85_00705 [Nanoarchaeota archaeon]